MSNLSIRKKSINTLLHTDSVFGDFIISKFYFNSFFAKFQIVEEGNARLEKYEIGNITLYDDTDGGVAETFSTITELSLRLEELQYPAFDRTGTSVFPSMEQITNVNVTDVEDGQVLAWDVATSKWVNITIGSSTTPTLQQVTDVNNELSTDINVKSTRFKVGDLDEDNIGVGLVIDNIEGSVAFYKNLINFITFNIDALGGTNSSGIAWQIILSEITENVNFYLPNKRIGDYTWDTQTEIINANTTAQNDSKYTVIANATFTDPTGVEGKGYTVFVRNGTATIGGVGYTAGSLVYRFYYSGAWSSTSIGGTVPDADASTKGIAKLYTDLLASNTDGSVTQSALVTEFNLKDVLPVIYEKHANVPIFGSASLNNLEGVTFAVTGGTARTFSDTSIYTRRQRLGLVTATTGNAAQMRQTIAYFNRNSNLLFIIGLGFAENCTNPNVRAFAGVCANLGVFGNTEPTALLNCIGLAKLTTSNNLHVIHNDGSGTATAIDLGVNFPSNTVETDFYILIGETNGSNINYTVNRVNTGGVATGTITTDLPSPSTALNLGYYVVQNTGANTNTGIDFFGTNLIKQ